MHNDTYNLDLQSRIVWAKREYFVQCDSAKKSDALQQWYALEELSSRVGNEMCCAVMPA